MVKARTLVAMLGLLAAAALPGAVPARGAAPPSTAAAEAYGHALANDLMSPFCPGRTLADCPSPDAATLRAWILVQEAAGRSRADVEAELLERYGEQLLSAPRARGFGVTAYAIPIGVFLAGGGLVWLFLRRQTRESRARSRAPEASLSPELERMVDEELAR